MRNPEKAKLTRREALRITALAGVSTALGGGLVAGLLRRAQLQRVSETHARLGTLVTVTAVHPELAAARAMVKVAFSEIDRLEAILSRHRPDTPVARLNVDGVVRDVPVELIEVVRRSEEYAELTEGAFDITVAPLLELYTARFDAGLPPPADTEIRKALDLVAYGDVRIDDRTISLARRGMAVTLDGIGKGYVVDRTVAVLVSAGAERVMIDAGGDIASGGREVAHDPWTIGIQDPHDPRASLGRVGLAGDAIATSGDYMQAFTDDRSNHHIIDPRTGHSPREVSSASVLTATAMDADALSTCLLVLGPEKGLRLIERIAGAEALIVSKGGEVWRSSGLSGYAV